MSLVSSVYKFIDPIRYHKENDPYYWEVDNIPLKQLQQNALWLKDQVLGLAQTDGVDRSEFNELRPYAEGGNNVIKVKPGRFTARINDAYRLSPLQKLRMVTGEELASFEQFSNPEGTDYASTVLSKLQSYATSAAMNLNGLSEQVLLYPVFHADFQASASIVNNLPSVQGTFNSSVRWPLIQNNGYYRNVVQTLGAAWELPRITSEFIKQFRGIARTSIVDIPSELQIEIPNFNPDDFFYYDTDNVAQRITGAEIRIDLLFIYSKPIDASSTTIQRWSGGSPTTITTPILGLVKGAGVGIGRSSGSQPGLAGPATDSAGNTQMLAAVSDQLQTTNGFQGLNIHGSFPSPDDLMNLAPLITEKLENSDPQLIGQSILPIAYIVVRSSADINTVGNTVITDEDIVDIRPFFRTTELTYNERAGIAAAIPAPSLANPITTQYTLDREVVRIKEYVDTVIGTNIISPRSVGGGMIWGGLSWGPEGAINQVLTSKGITENLFTNVQVPSYPDWDPADWWEFDVENASNSGQDKGLYRNDRINSYYKPSGRNLDGGTQDTATGSPPAGLLPVYNYSSDDSTSKEFAMLWVKKKVLINRSSVPWMQDYDVKVTLQNCLPIVAAANSSEGDNRTHATAHSVWVEKHNDYFIIYVGYALPGSNSPVESFLPQINRNSKHLAAWIARSSLFPSPATANQTYKFPLLGVCTYPTASFDVVGYPQNWFNSSLQQYPSTAELTLR